MILLLKVLQVFILKIRKIFLKNFFHFDNENDYNFTISKVYQQNRNCICNAALLQQALFDKEKVVYILGNYDNIRKKFNGI